MLDLRDMEILVALARHGHFGRAAASCGISQPAFSTRLRNLEQDIGAPVVRRGNRFGGFTPEGEIALSWARRVLLDVQSLKQDVSEAKKGLTGNIMIGAVPTAVPLTSRACARLHIAYPDLTIEIRSASSDQIRQDVTNFSMRAAVTYLSGVSESSLKSEHLYDERYVLLATSRLIDNATQSLSWTKAATLPLCLLSTDMNNRRIIDGVFRKLGVRPNVVLETNAFTAALAQVVWGQAATIVPELWLKNLPVTGDILSFPLDGPDVSEPVGMVWAGQTPEAPGLQAVLSALRDSLSL